MIAFRHRYKRRCIFLIITFCFAFLHSPFLARAWGTRAHRIVAHVATTQLSPQTQQKVAEIINSRSLATIADDADHWRKTRPETSPWHYVNIPLEAPNYDPRRDCPNGNCVISAIAKYRALVADRTSPIEARQEALAFLVHLVADAHQPLHCINNNDRGGNDVTVTFFGTPTNLHAVWDNGLLLRTHLGERAYTHRLITWLASQNLETLQRGTPVDWVLEAHTLARTHAYHLPNDHNLRSGYYRANLPIVDSQLAKAGIRLARVLNEALQTAAPGDVGIATLNPKPGGSLW